MRMWLYARGATVVIMATLVGIACMPLAPRGKNPALGLAPFEDEVQAFESADRMYPLAGGAVLFSGDSRIVRWQELDDDFDSHRVLNRGVSGARLAQLQTYTDRLIVPYAPRVVVLYIGEEDVIAEPSKPPERLMAELRRLLARIRVRLPKTPVFVLSLVPSPSRLDAWPALREVNTVMAGLLEARSDADYVDVATAMLNHDGEVRAEFFGEEGLHLTRAGYALWAAAVVENLARLAPPE